MPEHKYPDNAQDHAVSGRRTGKNIEGIDPELQFAEELYENGAYTNGMLGI